MGANTWTQADWAAAAAHVKQNDTSAAGKAGEKPSTPAGTGHPTRESDDSAALKKEQ